MQIFELAMHLRTPIYELNAKMSYQEFRLWLEYLEQRPVGWREDDRTYKLLRAAGVKAEPHQLFHSLALMKDFRDKRDSNPVPRKGSFLYNAIMSAKGGEQPAFLKDL